ncbi:MAG: GNAT family N-acetyltransferase [Caldimonas sp.]
MTEPEYLAWTERTVPAYAADKVASGQLAQADALDLARKEYRELLPDGLATTDNHLLSILDVESRPVGMLWFAVKTKFATQVAYLFDINVWPDRQREGHASRAFAALEVEVRRLGLSGIALHVFGHNTGAQALYAGLGFRPTNISLYKPVGAASD